MWDEKADLERAVASQSERGGSHRREKERFKTNRKD